MCIIINCLRLKIAHVKTIVSASINSMPVWQNQKI